MSRRAERADAGERQGMKRSTRMSITAGIVIFLSLTSSIGFAAWTASSSKSATATAGAVAVSTATSGGLATIAALGPFTYTSTNQSVTKPVTVRNTGSVEASVSSIAITSIGTLAGSEITARFWAGTSSACAATTPTITTTLGSGTVSLSTLNLTIAASNSAVLCVSTTFTGNMTTLAGQSISSSFTVRTSASANWVADDLLPSASRTFTQLIFKPIAPNQPLNILCVDNHDKSMITISWSTPSGFPVLNGGYNVYLEGVYLGNTTSASTLVSNRANTGTNAILTDQSNSASGGNTGNLTVRAVTLTGTESVDSAVIPIQPRSGNSGLSCVN
ncbi:hypothetical protein [Rhodoglobus aureus]|uniref:Fibronectin type-III domain-containing protein n=1 Tax=Rhodoglobus aureus TaxID=191497 RepID=A0ABN1VDX5_9MICO